MVEAPRRGLPNSRLGVTALLVALGAAGGLLIGTLLYAGSRMLLLGKLPSADEWIVGVVFGGGLGLFVGAVGAPLIAWGLLRHVPLGRAILVTGTGTVAGWLLGGLLAVNPFLLALAGFGASGWALGLASRRRLPPVAGSGQE